jgi:hypothetical protein
MGIHATNTFHTRPGRAAELIATLQQVLPDTLTDDSQDLVGAGNDRLSIIVSPPRGGESRPGRILIPPVRGDIAVTERAEIRA